jgi:hypothetical protein
MITYKYKRGTISSHPHTDVFRDGICIGYITKNKSAYAAPDENYNFTPGNTRTIRACYAATKPKLKRLLEELSR